MADEQAVDNGRAELRPTLHPVGRSERIVSIDVLRGFALLGILTMNIGTFSLASADFFNPTLNGNYEGANRIVWLVNHFLFDMKMMSIFSMLFGAGIILMAGRAETSGRSPIGLHYRRMGWLMFFGLIHAYFVWHGDILVLYALCGMLVYPLRRLSPRRLLTIGAIVLMIAVPLNMGMGLGMSHARERAAVAQAAIDAGNQPNADDRAMQQHWAGMRAGLDPTPEQFEAERRGFLGSYRQVFAQRAPQSLMMQTLLFVTWGVWRVCGLMLIGMALLKWGVFTASWPSSRYLTMSTIAYAIGWPLVFVGWQRMESTGFDVIRTYTFDWHFNYVGSVCVALGHIGLIMCWCRSAFAVPAQRALAAVGRTAFSNYIFQSLVCSTLFYGYGFGLYGTLERWELLYVVAGVWVTQILLTCFWVTRFRYGPLEWIWRSLTYARLEPIRLTPT